MRIGLMSSKERVPDSFFKSSEHLFGASGGNLGNFAYVHALTAHLANWEIVPWHASSAELKEKYDILIIACANQLGRHTDLAENARTLEQAALPVIAVGLGAQADSLSSKAELTAGTKRWITVIANHSRSEGPNIAVRGCYTAEILEDLKLGSATVVIGCPSNFINPADDLADQVDARWRTPVSERICVVGGMHYWRHLESVERSLISMSRHTAQNYIVQSGLEMVQLSRNELHLINEGVLLDMKNYFCPEISFVQFKNWVEYHVHSFIDAASWMEHMRRFDFVVGPRFHGIMLALQAGIPAGCISHDSRTAEMCETMKIPVIDYKDFASVNPDNLKSVFRFDHNQYRMTRKKLRDEYFSTLKRAGIAINLDYE